MVSPIPRDTQHFDEVTATRIADTARISTGKIILFYIYIYFKSSKKIAYNTGTYNFTNFNINLNQSIFRLELFFLVSSNASFVCNREVLIQLLLLANFSLYFESKILCFFFFIVRTC
jgi:hypothetical protein